MRRIVDILTGYTWHIDNLSRSDVVSYGFPIKNNKFRNPLAHGSAMRRTTTNSFVAPESTE